MAIQRRRRGKPMQMGRKAPYVMVGHWIAFSPALCPQAKAVYVVMLCYANGEDLAHDGSSEVWPAREAIAEAIGWSRPQSVDPHLDKLAALGAIEVIPPEPGDPDRNNHYIIHATPPEGYRGPKSQAEFSAGRRERRGARKGDAVERTTSPEGKRQVKGGAVERITRSDDTADRIAGDAVQRTKVVRSTAHEEEPLTRTREKEPGEASRVPHPREGARADTGPPPLKADWRNPHSCRCAAHLAEFGTEPGVVPNCPQCAEVRKWGETKRTEADTAAADPDLVARDRADRIAELERERAEHAAAVERGATALSSRGHADVRAILAARRSRSAPPEPEPEDATGRHEDALVGAAST